MNDAVGRMHARRTSAVARAGVLSKPDAPGLPGMKRSNIEMRAIQKSWLKITLTIRRSMAEIDGALCPTKPQGDIATNEKEVITRL